MAVHTFVEFEMPEAENFSDLTGIWYDLESARSFARKFQSVMEGENRTTSSLMRSRRRFWCGTVVHSLEVFVCG